MDGDVHAFLYVDERPGAGHGGRRRRPDRRRASRSGRWPGCRSPSRTCSPTPARRPPAAREILRGLVAAVPRDGDPAAAGRRHRDLGQDQHGRVRDGLLDRELRLRADPQPVGPGPDPRRVRRRVRRPRWPRSRRRWPSAPTPAARSGSRPRSPARSGSSRPTAARPGTGWSPWPPAWITPGPVRAYGAGRGPAAPGDRRPRPAGLDLDRRPGARRGRGGPVRRRGRAAGRRGQGARAARATPRGRAALPRGGRAARRSGRGDRRGVLPALRLRAAGVLPDHAQRGAPPTWPSSTRCASGCGSATTGWPAPSR